jgi:hypothetical protein
LGTAAKPFGGTFDGDNKTIYNLYIDTEDDTQGFIGVAADTAEVKNLNLEGTVTTAGSGAGLLSGSDISVVENVHVKGSVTSVSGSASGISSGGTIRNCSADVSVKGTTAGGLSAGPASIYSRFSKVTVEVGGLAGVLIGNIMTESITNSYSLADVKGSSAGGLIGQIRVDNMLSNSYAAGSVYGIGAAGGIAGDAYGGYQIVIGKDLIALNESVTVDNYILNGHERQIFYPAGRILSSVAGVATNGTALGNRCYARSTLPVNQAPAVGDNGSFATPPNPPVPPPAFGYYHSFQGADYTGNIVELARDTLGWDPEIWDFNVEEREYKLPILKSLIGTPIQDNLTALEHLPDAPYIY